MAESSRRREVLGSARAWTEEQIAALAEISLQDVEQARQAWRRDAPTGYADLLDAAIPDPLEP